MKSNFSKEHKIFYKDPHNPYHKSNYIDAVNNAATASAKGLLNFTTNPTTLLLMNLQIIFSRKMTGESDGMSGAENYSPTALLGNFPGFLAETNGTSHEEIQVS